MYQPRTTLQYFDYYIEQQTKLVGKSKTNSTIRTYKIRSRIFRDFLTSNGLDASYPDKCTIGMIRAYEIYLIGEKGYSNDYAMKCIQLVGRILKMAMENGAIKFNPIDLYEYHYERNRVLVFLSMDEIKRIEAMVLPEPLHRSREVFLFGCYTGLSYVDIKNFSKKNIVTGIDGRNWIEINRFKNGNTVNIPLLDAAEKILIRNNYLIQVKANKSINLDLKRIAKLARIKKVLTSHVARKSFGNVLHNEFNVPLETVSKMLGHKSIKTTESYYVQTALKKIAHDMKGIQFTSVA